MKLVDIALAYGLMLLVTLGLAHVGDAVVYENPRVLLACWLGPKDSDPTQ